MNLIDLTEKFGKLIDPDYESVKDGVCQNCTDCCSDIVPFSNEEVLKLKLSHPEYMDKIIEETVPNMGGTAKYLKNGDTQKCVFLVDRMCVIYEMRPDVCRVYGSSPFAMCGMEGKDKTPGRRVRNKLAIVAVKRSSENMTRLRNVVMKKG